MALPTLKPGERAILQNLRATSTVIATVVTIPALGWAPLKLADQDHANVDAAVTGGDVRYVVQKLPPIFEPPPS